MDIRERFYAWAMGVVFQYLYGTLLPRAIARGWSSCEAEEAADRAFDQILEAILVRHGFDHLMPRYEDRGLHRLQANYILKSCAKSYFHRKADPFVPLIDDPPIPDEPDFEANAEQQSLREIHRFNRKVLRTAVAAASWSLRRQWVFILWFELDIEPFGEAATAPYREWLGQMRAQIRTIGGPVEKRKHRSTREISDGLRRRDCQAGRDTANREQHWVQHQLAPIWFTNEGYEEIR